MVLSRRQESKASNVFASMAIRDMGEKIPDGFKSTIIVILSALVGSGGGVYSYMQVNPPREFPYTSRDAGADFGLLRIEISELRKALDMTNQNLHDVVVEMAKLPPDAFEDEVNKNTEFRLRHQSREDLHGEP